MVLSTPKLVNWSPTDNPLALSKYYAGFSPEFVRDAIKALNISPGETVLDPWAGQGTTGWISQQQGINSCLIDINPVMAIYAGAADAKLLSVRTRDRILHTIENLFSSSVTQCTHHCLSPEWAPTKFWDMTHSIFSHLDKQKLFSKNKEVNNELALVSAATFLFFKTKIKWNPTSNPTHFKIGSEPSKYRCSYEHFCKMVLQKAALLLAPRSESGNVKKNGTLKVFNGDSKSIPLPNEAVDFVITSPPYCTRIDYANLTLLELSVLSACGSTNVKDLRQTQMGSPVISKITSTPNDDWGKTCKNILSFVFNHDSHGSKNYYYKNLLKYFSDAYSSIQDIKRCLKPNGQGLLVVQNSYYKEGEIQLSKIYQEMFSSLDFEASKKCDGA
jgi:DNA modification methylase